MKFLKLLKQIGAITISDEMIDCYYRVSATKEKTRNVIFETSLEDRLEQMEEQIAKLRIENEYLRKNTEQLMNEMFQLRQDFNEIQEEKLTRDRQIFLEGIGV
jgi:predicted nuclease with TOPRIM domain